MVEEITIKKKDYLELKEKAEMFDRYIETEELSDEESKQIKKAMKGPFISEEEFLKRHPELE